MFTRKDNTFFLSLRSNHAIPSANSGDDVGIDLREGVGHENYL